MPPRYAEAIAEADQPLISAATLVETGDGDAGTNHRPQRNRRVARVTRNPYDFVALSTGAVPALNANGWESGSCRPRGESGLRGKDGRQCTRHGWDRGRSR